MKPLLILGFGNKARQGKDTAAEAVVNFYKSAGQEAKIFKFADALYETCRRDYGMKEKDSRLLQYVGTEVYRAKDPDYWVKQLVKSLEGFEGVAAISDVRFPNEIKAVKDMGGWTINVSRLNDDGTPYRSADRDPNHESEIALDNANWDFYIKAKTGQADLVGDVAISIVEHIEFQETR